MKQVSASGTEAFVRCPASHVLPQHESYNRANVGGTDNHHLVCQVINKQPGAAGRLEAAIPGLNAKLADYMAGVENVSAEDAYVVDVQARTSIHVGRDIGRQYEKALGRPRRKYEIGASLDLKGVKVGTWIRDLKFGIYSSWWQLYLQAMAVLWTPGCKDSDADAGFLHVDTQDEDNVSLWDDTATLYLSDLDERAAELMAAFSRAEALQAQMAQGVHYSDLKVIEGKWCQYCGAFPNCPAKWKLAKSMLDLDVVNHIGALTLDQCGAAWSKLAEIKKNIIAPMEAALKQRMATEGPLPTEDGKVYKLYTVAGRTTINKDKRSELLKVFPSAASYFSKGDEYTMVKKVNGPK